MCRETGHYCSKRVPILEFDVIDPITSNGNGNRFKNMWNLLRALLFIASFFSGSETVDPIVDLTN